ncbi:MAG: helix-turn-helix domain-containing protein [Marinoscillum sp.]
MDPSFNHWTVVFLAVAIQGVVLSLALSRQRSKSLIYLAGVVLGFSLVLAYYVTYWTGYYTLLPRGVAVAQGFTYFLGPFFLHYILYRHKRIRIHPAHWIPFLAYLVYFITYPWFVQEVRPYVIQGQVIFQNLHLLTYATLAVIYSFRYSKWKQFLAFSYAGYALSFLAYFVMVWTDTIQIAYDYFVSMTAAFCINYIGSSALIHRAMLTDSVARYDKSGLGESAANALHKELLQYMDEEKPFLESDLKMSDLAEALSFSSNHISQVINEREECNFSDFINQYRVEESKRLLQNDPQSTLIQVAYQAGFNNKVTFNNSFKKFTGLLPSEFRNAVTTQTPELQ